MAIVACRKSPRSKQERTNLFFLTNVTVFLSCLLLEGPTTDQPGEAKMWFAES